MSLVHTSLWPVSIKCDRKGGEQKASSAHWFNWPVTLRRKSSATVTHTHNQANHRAVRHESETGQVDEISPRRRFVQAISRRPAR